MKKTIVLAFVLAATLGLLVAGVAFAQDENPPFGDRGPKDGTGLLHDYMSEAMAQALGLTADELEAAHDAGKTFYDIAIENGIEEELRTLMQDARTSALEAAVSDGAITQEEVDQMKTRGGGRGGKRGGPGKGACDGSGQFEGSGFRGGGRGQGGNLPTTNS